MAQPRTPARVHVQAHTHKQTDRHARKGEETRARGYSEKAENIQVSICMYRAGKYIDTRISLTCVVH